MLPPVALSRILVAQHFSWPNQLVGFLLAAYYDKKDGQTMITLDG